jgi:hypothetical protein
MNFVTAHGYIASPTQRPYSAGLLTGIIAATLSILLMWKTQTTEAIGQTLGIGTSRTIIFSAIFMVIAGPIYAVIFRRTANDRRGGWMFGLVYGYLLWLLGPDTALQLWIGRPVLTGYPAIGLLCGELVYGLLLGLLFPWVHLLIQRRLDDVFLSWYYEKRPREGAEHLSGRKTALLKRHPTH